MATWIQSGFWGLVAGSALLLGAGIVDTMIPKAFETAHDFAGLITVAGFLTSFLLSKIS